MGTAFATIEGSVQGERVKVAGADFMTPDVLPHAFWTLLTNMVRVLAGVFVPKPLFAKLSTLKRLPVKTRNELPDIVRMTLTALVHDDVMSLATCSTHICEK